MARTRSKAKEKKFKPTLLGLPNDIFGIIVDELDRSALMSLRKSCKGLLASSLIEQAAYHKSLQLREWDEGNLAAWEFSLRGRARWENFKGSVNDGNRNYIKHIAASHWFSLDDFSWIEKSLPKLSTLDVSDVRDFMWTTDPDMYTTNNIWSWADLAGRCPELFKRIIHLKLFSWTDFGGHEHIARRYSSNYLADPQPFRLNRRMSPNGEHSGSVADVILKACNRLEKLSVRSTSSISRSWSPCDVHYQICAFVNPLINSIPRTLKHIQLHSSTPYLHVLVARLAKGLVNHDRLLITISLSALMKKGMKAPTGSTWLSARTAIGRTRNVEGEYFDDDVAFDDCEADHDEDARCIVKGSCDTFGQMLQQLSQARKESPKVVIGSHDSPNGQLLNPIYLIDPYKPESRVNGLGLSLGLGRPICPDIFNDSRALESLKWLIERMDWQPTFSWHTFMDDAFPEIMRDPIWETRHEFCDDIMDKIAGLFKNLQQLGVPVRVALGRNRLSPMTAYSEKRLYFTPMKVGVPSDTSVSESRFVPSQARFGLSHITHMIEDLAIKYPFDSPDMAPHWQSPAALSAAELKVMKREMSGWGRFWARYGTRLANLKRLEICVPRIIFEDWAKSPAVQALLEDPAWDVLNLDHAIPKRSTRVHFVRRTFFRRGPHGSDPPLMELRNLTPSTNAGVPAMNELRNFYEKEELQDSEPNAAFFAKFFKTVDKPKKRKHDGSDDETARPLEKMSTAARHRLFEVWVRADRDSSSEDE